ncbi:outer dense fiber protein 4 [Orycteropus afer afer]|uniref:Outer dense fiber protein 4 n=1 Tax=Orycteropus afer afer TaxID=1230840 RepID=A0A8B7ASM1_ORYAF|nr:outer dense fiber protein 4 [Orycteropus afer afer]
MGTRHSPEGNRGLWDEFQESEEERSKQQRPGKEEEDWGAEQNGSQEAGTREEVPGSISRSNRQLVPVHHQGSVLSLRWSSSYTWTSQVLTSLLSLIAFILLLVMAFSKKWLYLSGSRFFQRWPANVSARIYTTANFMSMGLLHTCKARSCYNLEQGKVTFIFVTLMLFPINLWIFEWEKNLSIPIGWSYFIGWLVFFLYVTCAALCYFNQKNFWRLVLMHPFGIMSWSNHFRSVGESLSKSKEVTDSQMEAPNPEEEEDISNLF